MTGSSTCETKAIRSAGWLRAMAANPADMSLRHPVQKRSSDAPRFQEPYQASRKVDEMSAPTSVGPESSTRYPAACGQYQRNAS